MKPANKNCGLLQVVTSANSPRASAELNRIVLAMRDLLRPRDGRDDLHNEARDEAIEALCDLVAGANCIVVAYDNDDREDAE